MVNIRIVSISIITGLTAIDVIILNDYYRPKYMRAMSRSGLFFVLRSLLRPY